MPTLLTNNRSPRLPEDRQLERLVARLASVRSAVGVVRLVERWATVRPPTRMALLAEAKAFVDLRLMDRAWVRLRELSDADESDAEVLALTAEMFIARGWPARAARLVEKLQVLGVDAERLKRIEDSSSAPPLRPPSNARELERNGTLEQQIALAETFLATGSVLRARGVLERLSRTHGAHPRVQQLLWGLRGEFTAGQQSLSGLVTELQTGLSSDGGWEASEPTASLDHADPETAEASKVLSGGWQPAPSERGGAFSSLFRMGNEAGDSSDDLEDDVTVAAVMASHEEMADPPTWEHSDPDGVIASSSGDTQIMQVIGSGENRRLTPVTGEVHTRSADQKRGPVDLRAWRAEHGVVAGNTLLDAPTIDGLGAYDDEGFLEEEDEDVVVMTHKEEAAPDLRAPVQRRSPISVIEKVPAPPAAIPDLPGQDEVTPTVGPAPALLAPPPPSAAPMAEPTLDLPQPEDPERDPLPAAQPLAPTSWGALVAVAVVLVMLFGSVLAVLGLRAWFGSAQTAEVRQAVLDSQPNELFRLRSQLQDLHESGGVISPSTAHVATGLILVDLALWEVVSGDPAALQEALSLAEAGMAGPDKQLASAWIDRAVGTPVSFEGLGDNPLVALLRAEEAIDAGQWADAARALDGVPLSSGVRIAIADIHVREQDGLVSAEALPESVRSHPLGMLWMYSGGDASLSDKQRIAYLRAFFDQIPPEAAKLRSDAKLAEARIWMRSGSTESAEAAWAEALKANPHDPIANSYVAASARRDARSMKLLRDCLAKLPSSAPCQRGLIQLQIESGDLASAREYVDRWREAGLGVGMLADWVRLQGGETSIRPGPPEPADPDRAGFGLTRYLDALAQTKAAARKNGLEKAVSDLRESQHPWDHRLADHIEQHKAQLIEGVED